MSKSASILKVRDWPSFFKTIRSRPAMYLGSISITALYHIIGGIRYAELFYNVRKNKRFKGFSFERFEYWVAGKFNKRKLAVRSFGLAKIKAKSEEKAFALWFQWYDAYREKNRRSRNK